jgi:hypothetical protein
LLKVDCNNNEKLCPRFCKRSLSAEKTHCAF